MIQVCLPRCSGFVSKLVTIIHPPPEFPKNFEFQMDLSFSSFFALKTYCSWVRDHHILPQDCWIWGESFLARKYQRVKKRTHLWEFGKHLVFKPRLSVDCYISWFDTSLLNFWVYFMPFLKNLLQHYFLLLKGCIIKKKIRLTNFYFLEMIKQLLRVR